MSNDQSIYKTVRDLMITKPFYGAFLASVNKRFSSSIETACIQYNQEYLELLVNETYWNSLNDLQKCALLEHEVLHICYNHFIMYTRYTDKTRFNYAADLEINQYINNLKEGLHVEDFRRKYPHLNFSPKAGTDHYYNELSKISDKDLGNFPFEHNFNNMTDVSDQINTQSLCESAIMSAYNICKSHGNIPSNILSIVNNIISKKSKVDWKQELRKFSKTKYSTNVKLSRYRESKRFPDSGSLKKLKKAHILVAIDTSGSIGKDEFELFMSEVKHIYNQGSTITLVQCDAKIHYIEDYTPTSSVMIKGGGGTSFQPVIDYYNDNHRKFNTLIYLTDGYAATPNNVKKPVLWVISHNNQTFNLPGKTIYIT
jgi:predicted metal-dependent peptidase